MKTKKLAFYIFIVFASLLGCVHHTHTPPGPDSTITVITKAPSPPLDINAVYYPCGWIGDGQLLGTAAINYDPNYSVSPHSKPDCIKISYYNMGSDKWAGIYWLNQDANGNCNWGDTLGFNLSQKGYTKITFWAKGENGNEQVQFKAGGVKQGTYKDSFDFEPKLVVNLTKDWQQYTIDLTGQNLSNVIGGFCWVAKSRMTFYLDDIYFE